MSKKKEVYLGDGLYGRIDVYGQIELRACREFKDHFVYINEENIESLMFLIMDYNSYQKSLKKSRFKKRYG